MTGIEVTRTIYDAFARGDVARLLGHVDPHVEWRLAEGHPYSPAGTTWIGHEAVVENFFARAEADWDSGTFGATGRSLDAQGCHVWRLRDGKVTSFQQYLDTNQLRAVMGDG